MFHVGHNAFLLFALLIPWDQFTLIYNFSHLLSLPWLFFRIEMKGIPVNLITSSRAWENLVLKYTQTHAKLLVGPLRTSRPPVPRTSTPAYFSVVGCDGMAFEAQVQGHRCMSDLAIPTLLKARKLNSQKNYHHTWEGLFCLVQNKNI